MELVDACTQASRLDSVLIRVAACASEDMRFSNANLIIHKAVRSPAGGRLWIIPVEWSTGRRRCFCVADEEVTWLSDDDLVTLLYERFVALVIADAV